MANRNFSNAGKMYTMHVMPALLDCNFIVDSSNANGLGIRSLKGPMIQNVFMHTSMTPGEGNRNPATPNVAVTNPNPAPGTIVIQLQDNFNQALSGFTAVASPTSGTPLTATVTGTAYIITALGTATAAQWRAAGVPAGVTPAVGVSFIAAQTATIGGSAAVQIPADAGSGILTIEMVGDASLSIAPNPAASQGFGAQIIMQCRKDSSADLPTVAAPANGTVISLAFLLSNSSVRVMGE